MKKIFYFTVWMALLMLTKGCYTDKGNYEYAVMGDVTIDVTSAMYSYSAILGEHLNIPMTVTTAKVSSSWNFSERKIPKTKPVWFCQPSLYLTNPQPAQAGRSAEIK